MKIPQSTGCEDLNRIYAEICELGLEVNLAQLEAFGFTIIEGALTPEETAAARDAVVRAAEARFGKKLDLESETEHHNVEVASYLLYKDRAFEAALLSPKPLALITYLLGYSCCLSSMTSHVKGPGEAALLIHSDTGNPAPFSPYSQVANTNYALTDYTEAGGCLAMVPGSHRYARQPTMWEKGLAGNERNPHAVPIEVPAGSAIVWHGATWHGSFPRQIPGLRINLATYYCREQIEPQELYRYNVPDGLLDRYGPDFRMATLLGQHKFNGWADEGPNMEVFRRRTVGSTWQA